MGKKREISMKLLNLKDLNDFKTLRDWCLTVYDYLVNLHSDFLLETEWYRGVINKAEAKSDLRLMKRVYKETNLMIRETLTPILIEQLNNLLNEKYGHCIADEIDKETEIIQKIIKRGKIRNDREFELVKRREEEIWEDGNQMEYAETLRRMMGDYEVPEV